MRGWSKRYDQKWGGVCVCVYAGGWGLAEYQPDVLLSIVSKERNRQWLVMHIVEDMNERAKQMVSGVAIC